MATGEKENLVNNCPAEFSIRFGKSWQTQEITWDTHPFSILKTTTKNKVTTNWTEQKSY